MFMAEIEALQAFQKTLLGILQDLTGTVGATASPAAATAGDSLDGLLSAAGSGLPNNGFGTFAEAQALSAAYANTVRSLVRQFEDVGRLAHAVLSALGDGAQKYDQTESEITASFTKILREIGM
jgi:hypothetical protein